MTDKLLYFHYKYLRRARAIINKVLLVELKNKGEMTTSLIESHLSLFLLCTQHNHLVLLLPSRRSERRAKAKHLLNDNSLYALSACLLFCLSFEIYHKKALAHQSQRL